MKVDTSSLMKLNIEETAMDISIRNEIGTRCITQEDGQIIYNIVRSNLLNGKNVVIDFEGVSQFASPFFNFAVGQLLKDIQYDTIQKLLVPKNLNQVGNMLYKKVLENAKEYHSNSKYREAVDAALNKGDI